MKITLLGTGGAWPDAERSAPAFLLEHEGKPFLVDCGGGVCHQLMKVGVAPSKLTTIFLTHIHIDHCVEFPSLVFGAYLTGKEGSFQLIGPNGVDHFANSIFKQTYDFSIPMMKKLRNKDISVLTKEETGGTVFNENGLVVEAITVEHGFPALAYKFSSAGKSVVFSGDTQPCENIVHISEDVDLLIIDCSFPEQSGPKNGHCIPSQVGKIAQSARPKGVCLIHLFPPCKGKESEMIAEVRRHFDGEVFVGNDLQSIDV